MFNRDADTVSVHPPIAALVTLAEKRFPYVPSTMALQHSEHSSSDVEVLLREAEVERLLAPGFSPGFNFRGNFGGMPLLV